MHYHNICCYLTGALILAACSALLLSFFAFFNSLSNGGFFEPLGPYTEHKFFLEPPQSQAFILQMGKYALFFFKASCSQVEFTHVDLLRKKQPHPIYSVSCSGFYLLYPVSSDQSQVHVPFSFISIKKIHVGQ